MKVSKPHWSQTAQHCFLHKRSLHLSPSLCLATPCRHILDILLNYFEHVSLIRVTFRLSVCTFTLNFNQYAICFIFRLVKAPGYGFMHSQSHISQYNCQCVYTNAGTKTTISAPLFMILCRRQLQVMFPRLSGLRCQRRVSNFERKSVFFHMIPD